MYATLTTPRTVYAARIDESRLRTRYLGQACLDALVDSVREAALSSGRWAHDCTHAGDVPNNYGYPAATSGALVVSDPDGNVVVWMCRLPANKVTLAGVCGHTVPAASPLYDRRYGAEAKRAAERDLQREHREEMAAG